MADWPDNEVRIVGPTQKVDEVVDRHFGDDESAADHFAQLAPDDRVCAVTLVDRWQSPDGADSQVAFHFTPAYEARATVTALRDRYPDLNIHAMETSTESY